MKLSTILRLVAIALGIVAATIMAQRGFHISFNELFARFFDAIDEFLSGPFGLVEKYAVHPMLEELRRLGIHFKLQSHWRYDFLLLWLFFGSVARTVSAGENLYWPAVAFTWLWGGVCAFVGGVLSGTADASNVAIVVWPLFALLLWVGGFMAMGATRSKLAGEKLPIALIVVMLVCLFLLLVAALLSLSTTAADDALEAVAGLALLAIIVVFLSHKDGLLFGLSLGFWAAVGFGCLSILQRSGGTLNAPTTVALKIGAAFGLLCAFLGPPAILVISAFRFWLNKSDDDPFSTDSKKWWFEVPSWYHRVPLIGLIVLGSLGVLWLLLRLFERIPTNDGLGFAWVAASIAFIGFVSLLLGTAPEKGDKPWVQRWLGSAFGRFGVDVLFVLGGATFITFVAHELA